MRLCRADGCQRAALSDSTLCDSHLRFVLAAAFAPASEERRTVERLSESDPFCVSVAESKRGTRTTREAEQAVFPPPSLRFAGRPSAPAGSVPSGIRATE